ncbi:MAG: NAD-dependent epimerase/dehydratase family protein [Polyangiales bacterium]
MRHLITGGAGFIGSHLAELLLARGDSVVALDDLSTGSQTNIAAFETTGRFTFVLGTILDGGLVDRLVSEADDVYHLAAAVGVRRIMERGVDALVTNTTGTDHVLRSAARHQRPVLIASSSEVYAASDAVPFTEDAGVTLGSTMRPRWGYACSKAFDEFLAFAYAREQGLRVVVVRLFNTVGPRQTGRYGMVVPNFVRQALAGEPLTVFGDGTQTRCFTWVGDVVDAMSKLLAEPRAWAGVCNLGSIEEVSILQLAQRIIARTNSVSKVVLVPFDQAFGPEFDDMQRRVPSLARAEALIGYRPTMPLDAILDRVIQYEESW